MARCQRYQSVSRSRRPSLALEKASNLELAEQWEEFRDRHLHNGEYHPELIAWNFVDVHRLPEPIYGAGQPGLFSVDKIQIAREWRVYPWSNK